MCRSTKIALVALCLLLSGAANAVQFKEKAYGVSITSDVIYTFVSRNGGGSAAIRLDVYEPIGVDVPAVKPAFILLHGGGHTINDKSGDATEFPPSSGMFINSSITEYAMAFARRGYVCISIDYPKTYDYSGGTDYALGNGYLSTIGADTTVIAAGINAFLASISMGTLPEVNIINTIEADIQCAIDAVDWVTTNAGTYGIDPDRIAMGGWSAGANIALNAKNAGANVAALWLNSAGGLPVDPSLTIDSSTPSTIQFHGDMDTIIPVASARLVRDELVTAGVTHEYYETPGGTHFYFIDDTIAVGPTRSVPDTLENLLADFMFSRLHLFPIALPAQSNAGLVLLALLLVGLAVGVVRRTLH